MDDKHRALFGQGIIFMDKNKNLYEMCKGCSSYGLIFKNPDGRRGYNRACNIEYPILSPTSECPCIKCLIKGICDNPCSKYNEYRIYEMTVKDKQVEEVKKKLRSRKRN